MASIKLKGDTSGEITIQAPSVAGTNTLNLQASSGTLATTAQASIGMKNLIINGDMNIAQRGTSSTGITAGGYYTVDRWRQQISGGGTYTQAQTALTSSDAPFADGFSQSVKYDCTTAYTSANSFNVLRQIIEGQNLQQLAYGTSSAKSLTLSFWVKSNVTGTAVASLYSADSNKHIGQTYTIDATNTWEYKTVTFVGDTASTFDNDNNASLYVNLMMATGTDYTSGTLPSTWTTYSNADFAAGQTIDISASTSNEISFTGVQLESGTTATPFEHLQYGQQLALCQRYYEYGTRNFYGSTDSAGNIVSEETYKVVKRATPTMVYGTWTWARSGTGGSGSAINYQTNLNKWSCYIGTGSGYVAAWSAGSWTASSEL